MLGSALSLATNIFFPCESPGLHRLLSTVATTYFLSYDSEVLPLQMRSMCFQMKPYSLSFQLLIVYSKYGLFKHYFAKWQSTWAFSALVEPAFLWMTRNRYMGRAPVAMIHNKELEKLLLDSKTTYHYASSPALEVGSHPAFIGQDGG